MLALSVAATVAAVVWAYLVAGHGGYWRTSQWLPRVAGAPDRWPDVVAVVPARNEAAMLPVTLPALLVTRLRPPHWSVSWRCFC
jgi:hypothetical protein